ncbi:SdrD B-like domain-containing protein, partial [Niabella drilacis]
MKYLSFPRQRLMQLKQIKIALLPVFTLFSLWAQAQCDKTIWATGSSSSTGSVYKLDPDNAFAQLGGPYTGPTGAYGWYSIAQPGNGFVYMATMNAAVTTGSATIYRLSTTAPAGTQPANTGITLPLADFSNEYYISGASDPQGNAYFITDHGYRLTKYVPATGAVSIVWDQTITAATGSPALPSGVTFHTEQMNMTIDANGDYYFITANTGRLFQVKKGTTKYIYRGQVTGVTIGGGVTITDLVFANGKVYVSTSNSGSPGTSYPIYELNTATMAATAVGTTGSYSDLSNAPCAAISMARINGSLVNDKNGMTDGVNGAGLSGITVNLYDNDGNIIATTTTDANGNYSFSTLTNGSAIPAGNYSIGIVPPAGFQNVSSTDAVSPYDGRTPITLGATGGVNDVDFGLDITANPDFNSGYVNQQMSGNLNTNDKVPAGSTYGAPAIPSGVNNPGNSVPTIDPATGKYTFTGSDPGVYTFDVPVCTSGTPPVCTTNRLTITVAEPNSATNPPVANPDLATMTGYTSGTPPAVTLNTLANDQPGSLSPALNPASVTPTQPAHGTVTKDALGNITYTPDPGFVGKDTIPYQVCDLSVPTPKCTSSYQVVTVNAPGTANSTSASDDYATAVQGASIVRTAATGLKANDVDPEGNATTITGIGGTALSGGTAT